MKQCFPCSDKSNCFGGDKIAPKMGFWRIGDYSDNFVVCPEPDSCLYYIYLSINNN